MIKSNFYLWRETSVKSQKGTINIPHLVLCGAIIAKHRQTLLVW